MRRRLLWALGIVLAGLPACVAARLSPAFAQSYARFLREAVYPVLGGLFSRVRAPASELLAVALSGAAAYGLIRGVGERRAGRWAANASLALAVAVFAYGTLWMPLYAANADEEPEYSTRALSGLCERLIDEANALAGCGPTGGEALLGEAEGCLDALGLPHGGSLKLARYPEWMRAFSIAGIYLPWTFEAIVNPSEPALTQPFTACHEAAHARGIASEAQANLTAYFACLNGGEFFQYSAKLVMLRYALFELRARDEALWNRVCARMSRDTYADFAGINGFAIDLGGSAASDFFLRASGEARGAASYSDVVGALIRFNGEAN